LGVDDPLRSLSLLVERGGQQLGPTLRDSQGSPYAFVRDPFGAKLALGARRGDAESPASWHLLHVTDHEAALAFYVELFGWHPREERELPGHEGHSQRFFAWNESGDVVGAVTNAARVPQIHDQWLHFFGTPSVSSACAAVRAHGALALEPTRTESGDAFAASDDPEGAAFGLYEQAPR
jgi:predicted enzyme related to lactoylglutathione lyase